MPIIQSSILQPQLISQRAKWVAKDTWITNLPEVQRKAMLGVSIDRANLAEIAQKAAAQPLMATAAPLPTMIDWRSKGGRCYVSPVKDQANCGSCVSFGTVAIVESAAAIERGQLFLDLSEADLHFCSSHGANCGGWWPTSALAEVKSRGVVGEADFPYARGLNGGSPQCLPVSDRAHKATKISSWSTLSTMSERKKWLVEQGPVAAVFHVYDDFFSYGGGVYSHVTGGEAGYHCVAVVGYDDSNGCWICKNSWGPNWGDHGYFRIAYGQCGIDDTSNDHDATGGLLRFPMWGVDAVVLPPPASPQLSDIEAAINSDGRLEVFGIARADANSVWNIWQSRPAAGPWGGPGDMNGQLKQISSALNGDGRLELFGIGMDNAVWHTWQMAPHAGPWSGWSSLGGRVKQIDTMRNSDGRLEVFGIGMDDGLWNIWQTRPAAGPWSGWGNLGGKVKQLTAGCNSDGRLEVFAIGTDNAVWHKWQTAPHAGPWSNWASLRGIVSQIDVERNSDGRLELFGIGSDGGLWNIWQTRPSNGWSNWNKLI